MNLPGDMNAERDEQPLFSSRGWILSLLSLTSAILLAATGLQHLLPDRPGAGPGQAIRFAPIALDGDVGPFRLAGAWTMESDDPRLGGISGLALDGRTLVAISDSGVAIRFTPPGTKGPAPSFLDLPDGPGDGSFKKNRDSEAIRADPAGRGWWVAFERHHELWLYDRDFSKAIGKIGLPGDDWPDNKGVEALVAADDRLVAIPEGGGLAYRIGIDGGMEVISSVPASATEAALIDGRLLLVERQFGIAGFTNALLLFEGDSPAGDYRRYELPFGLTANVEALAVERRANGFRLWLMTDDNHQRPMRTLLIALDLPSRTP